MRSLLYSSTFFALVGAFGFVFNLNYELPENDFSVVPVRPTTGLADPVLSPSESIRQMQVDDGFEVKLVAAEPLVVAPVAMTFDNRGRLWVVEMTSYMPDTVATGEERPTGKIVILEDANRDGLMDKRKVFLDSLVLPRAICLLEGGVLIGESPNLYFVPVKDDRPGKKVLVDNKYNEGGNVEHYPNGLYRGLDNWIYNAKSSKRYRRIGEEWLIEKTHFRGQWGISQDDHGRLFYNFNTENLQGDYFTPGLGAGNPNQRNPAGFSENIIRNNRLFPIRPNPGVNRGYQDRVLDAQKRLVNFTAACGPLIYRGNLFGKEFAGNAFVAEPAGNLVKRNILVSEGNVVKGRQAYPDREFLASTDERFRPVNLYDGPDGALYVVDMYRGIIQHKTFLTPYLRNQIRIRDLTLPLSCGRIYKVVPKNKKTRAVRFSDKASKLVAQLTHPNGWVRDRAQQTIIDARLVKAVPALRKMMQDSGQPLAAIHALWTLEGLRLLQHQDVLPLLQSPDWVLRRQALSVVPVLLNQNNHQQLFGHVSAMVDQKDALAAPYVGFLIPHFRKFNPAGAEALTTKLLQQFPSDLYVASSVVSGLSNREEVFLKDLNRRPEAKTWAIQKELLRVMEDRDRRQQQPRPENVVARFPRGAAIFNTSCAPCHGADGGGQAFLAPPLNSSEWVTGNKNHLTAIVLYGLTGPVPVRGKVYQAPEINGDMPGIGANAEFSDADIAQVLSFIRNSWNNKAQPVTAEEVKQVRQQVGKKSKPFTVSELQKI